MQTQEKKRKLRKMLTAIIPVLLLAILVLWQPLYSGDAFVSDRVYAQKSGVLPNIKIIAVDEASLEAYGSFDMWSREKTAQLLELLYADPETSPALIGLDIMFTGETDPAADASLVQACQKAQPVVLASNLAYKSVTKRTADGKLYQDVWNVGLFEKPFAALDAACESGFANAYMADDGRVRYTKLQETAGDELVSNFAWLLYEALESAQGREPVMPAADASGMVQFFYSGKPGEYPHFSLKDVLDGKIPVSEFTDCVVLVGAYAPGFQDAYGNAAHRGRLMYGVEIQANILQALVQGKTAVPCPLWLYLIPALLATAGYFWLAQRQKLAGPLAEGLLLIAVHLALGRIAALHGFTFPQIYFILVIFFGMIYFVGEKYLVEKLRKRKLLASFKTYVAPQVVDVLAKDDAFAARLGGEKRHVAVLFVDIRGFTPLSESLQPEEVVTVLNKYLALTTSCILKNDGMLDKFIGDATMAIFNAPVDLDDYVFKAVCAAVDMRKGAEQLAAELKALCGKTVSFGIGVNCGDAVIGNIGCEFRMDYTAIGDTVNTAARLESRAAPAEILISDAVYQQVKDRIDAEFVGAMELKGKANTVQTYRVLAVRE